MIMNQALTLVFLLTCTFSAEAEIYKWIDAEGKAHFSGSKPAHTASVENRNELERKSLPPTPVDNQIQAAPTVDLYVTSWCPYCKKAIAFLRKNHMPFKALDIEQDHNAAARKKALDPGYSGIPLAVINGATIRGFDEDSYQQAIARR